MKPVLRTCACLLGILIASLAPAMCIAGVQGETLFGNIRYHLIDLDLNDGVTPHLEIQPEIVRNGYGIARMEIVTNGRYAGSDSQDGWTDSSGAPFTLAAEIAGNQIDIDMLGRGSLSTLSMSSRAAVVEGGTTLGRGYSSLSGDRYRFSLSANTGVVFEADMRTTAGISGRAGLDQWFNAATNMQLWLNGEAPDNSPGVDFFYGSVWLRQGINTSDDADGRTLDTAGTLQLAFENIMDTTRDGSFNYSLELNVGERITPPPIPEPSTYMMFMAGLGMCLLYARRAMAYADASRNYC